MFPVLQSVIRLEVGDERSEKSGGGTNERRKVQLDPSFLPSLKRKGTLFQLVGSII